MAHASQQLWSFNSLASLQRGEFMLLLFGRLYFKEHSWWARVLSDGRLGSDRCLSIISRFNCLAGNIYLVCYLDRHYLSQYEGFSSMWKLYPTLGSRASYDRLQSQSVYCTIALRLYVQNCTTTQRDITNWSKRGCGWSRCFLCSDSSLNWFRWHVACVRRAYVLQFIRIYQHTCLRLPIRMI